MYQKTTENEFLQLAKAGKRVAVFREVPSDLIRPIAAFQALSQGTDGSVLLESGVKDPKSGRSSFIGLFPYLEFSAKGRLSQIITEEGKQVIDGDPLKTLRAIREKYGCVGSDALSPLVGGLVGFVSYDAVRLFEEIPDRHEEEGVPDLQFYFHEVCILFDHFKDKLTVSVAVEVGNDPKLDYQRGVERIEEILSLIEKTPTQTSVSKMSSELGEVKTDLSDAEYCQIVERAKQYIVQGDAFQIVLSRQFSKSVSARPIDVYRALCLVNASPFMFLVQGREFAIAGSSPEKLVSLENGQLETIPMAGTRPRAEGEADMQLEKELLADEKEAAEHNMLVDLSRNDLGIVSTPGSVQVAEYKTVRRFARVMHLVSRVVGELREEYDAFDALRAAFPAGTLSGAPKIRAMEIIDELESSKRGVYGGAVCLVDRLGNLESCIAIRMAFLKNGVATVRAGAGIVYDSDPQKEADETRHKARAVLEAIQVAQEVLS